MRDVILAVIASPLAFACTISPRTGLAVASTRAVAVPMTVIATDVEGKTCTPTSGTGRSIYVEAVEEALRTAPGANALVNAQFDRDPFALFTGCFLSVRGTAVRIESK